MVGLNVSQIDALLADADFRQSFHHGEKHWRGVAQAGWYLAAADPRVDPTVVLAFAVLHDSRRENEFSDPDHGARAAARLGDPTDRAALLALEMSARQIRLLHEALRIHNGAVPADVHDPTVAACLDADRLNLWRVGHTPDPKLLCTEYARRPEVIAWAKRLCAGYCPLWKSAQGSWLEGTEYAHTEADTVPLLSWAQLSAVYADLERRPVRKTYAFGERYGAGVDTATRQADRFRASMSEAESRVARLFAR